MNEQTNEVKQEVVAKPKTGFMQRKIARVPMAALVLMVLAGIGGVGAYIFMSAPAEYQGTTAESFEAYGVPEINGVEQGAWQSIDAGYTWSGTLYPGDVLIMKTRTYNQHSQGTPPTATLACNASDMTWMTQVYVPAPPTGTIPYLSSLDLNSQYDVSTGAPPSLPIVVDCLLDRS